MSQIAIRDERKQESGIQELQEIPNVSCILYSRGFTLIELMITLAVIAIIITFASSPSLESGNAKKTFKNTLDSLQTELSSLKNEAAMRNTTTRMVITLSAGVYTINTFYSSVPVSTCSTAGTWTPIISSKILKVPSSYQLTGTTAMAGTCFNRDGSSYDSAASGAVFTLELITATPGYGFKKAVLSVIMATGFQDVVITEP